MFKVFLSYLLDNFKREILQTKEENQQVEYKVKLESIENTFGDHKCIFTVIHTTTKGRIKDILKVEEKLRIESDKTSYTGTLVDIVGNELHVLLYQQIPLREYKVVRLVNYNNFVLFKQLRNLKPSEEYVSLLSSAFSMNIVRRCEDLIKAKQINKVQDSIIVLYMHSLMYLKDDVERDELYESIEEKKFNSVESILVNIISSSDETVKYLKQAVGDLLNQSDRLKLDTIFSSNIVPLESDADSPMTFFDKNLNLSQKMAVKAIKKNSSYKIIGPPGTGKTSTIVEIISQLLKMKMKILVCAPSNISIDNIIDKFVVSEYYEKYHTKFYRRGSAFKGSKKFNLESIVEELTRFVEREDTDRNFKRTLGQIKDKYKREIQLETDLVFSTTFSSRKEEDKFDWVIVDEACQSKAMECFLALTHGKNIILVGDPNQLCPESHSLFDLLDMDAYLLDVQYRMCERLISFSNESFYGSQIKSFIKESHSIIEDSPIVFIDTRNEDYQESCSSTSKTNLGEVGLVVEVVRYLKSRDIGVISPYSAQVLLLKKRLPSLEVATVDGFQGREKEFIIISLVRSNSDGEFGFLDNYKRLNVAITRCKKGLIVIGNSDNFRKCGVINRFLKYIERKFISIDSLEIDEYFNISS